MKVQEGSSLALKKHLPLARLLAGGLIGLASALSAAAELDPKDVLSLSPEDLSRLQVTSVSRRPELLLQAAASVYVITSEDIRRAPATTLTEVLRLAPGLFVPFDNAVPGFVSARGQTSGIYSGPNKMLVLVDGRSVYSPWFAGVFWDTLVPVLADIERIEVINGPAGVLWGSNAVNGVINIITKNAAQTQGVLASAGSGDRARDGVFRYGGALGEDGHYRIYGQSSTRSPSIRQSDRNFVDDDSRKTSAGGRMDWQRGANALSAQFNALAGDEGQPSLQIISPSAPAGPYPRIEMGAFNALGRWTYAAGDGSSLAVQMYFDHTLRRMQPTLNQNGDLIDLEIQRNEALKGTHKLTWGGNIRLYREQMTGSDYVVFLPETVTQRWLSLFMQDEISLSQTMRLTAGARLERGPYGTTDLLPTLRLSKRFGEGQMLWGGLSRAARTPTRLDTDFNMLFGGTFFAGNRDVRSEHVDVAELGYRYQGQAASASVTLYKNYYKGLTTVDLNATPFTTGNLVGGQAKGIEAWAEYRLNPDWRLSGGFTLSSDWYAAYPGVNSVPIDSIAGTSPSNTLQLRSSWNLPWRTELDLVFRHSGRLGNPNDPTGAVGNAPFVPSNDAIDLRLGWKLSRQLQLDVIGQNLFGTEHAEFGTPAARALMTQRIYTRLTWRQ